MRCSHPDEPSTLEISPCDSGKGKTREKFELELFQRERKRERERAKENVSITFQTSSYHSPYPLLTCMGLLLESRDVIVSRGLSLPFNVSQRVSALKYVLGGTLLVHFQILVINRLYV